MLKPICLIPLECRADDCPENPMHKQRKDLSDIVEFV